MKTGEPYKATLPEDVFSPDNLTPTSDEAEATASHENCLQSEPLAHRGHSGKQSLLGGLKTLLPLKKNVFV